MTEEPGQNPFTGAWLDRRSESRGEADWAARALAEPETRFLVSSGTLNGRSTIVVVLKDSTPHIWDDSENLLRWSLESPQT